MGEDVLVVDGYNIIHAWPDLIRLKNESFEHARDKLLDILADFRGSTQCLVVVVFDAYMVKKRAGNKESIDGLEVIFTQEGETADSCIERLVSQLPRETRVIVATSDWAQQRLVVGQGALRLSARELLNRVNEVRKQNSFKMNSLRKNSATLDDAINPDLKETLEKWRRGK